MSGTGRYGNYDLLARPIQRWIYRQEWPTLRDIQDDAIPIVLEGKRDLLIAAATASGKTEAAFLPICSALLTPTTTLGVRTLYVGPLKALINDQFRRAEQMCRDLGVLVTHWHEDAPGAAKARLRQAPSGILLITPESLEALLVLAGTRIRAMFEALQYIVVDELHAFLGTERGVQLMSLLNRVEHSIRRRIPRIGLSATLGDMRIAAAQLRPDAPDDVVCLISRAAPLDLRLQMRGYEGQDRRDDPSIMGPADRIADHLFRELRGRDNLVFVNSRNDAELYTVLLRERTTRRRVPNEFYPHHAGLTRELREHAEQALRSPTTPATIVATSTLEMGIDIGSVDSVAQIGIPPSVAALRQRLGRSGRRSNDPVLRCYNIEKTYPSGTAPLAHELRVGVVQTAAMLGLLLDGWCEPPEPRVLHLSTLTQQLLSLTAQLGGVSPDRAYRILCSSGSPFSHVTSQQFAGLLRALGTADALVQAGDGSLLAGQAGEEAMRHFSFYAVFDAGGGYQVFVRDHLLGVLRSSPMLVPGGRVAFGGRSWRIVNIEAGSRVINVEPAPAAPRQSGDGWETLVHPRVRERMRQVYESTDIPRYCHSSAADLIMQGRAAYRRLGLSHLATIRTGRECTLLPWVGSKQILTLAALLRHAGAEVTTDGFLIEVESSVSEIQARLHAVAAGGVPTAAELAEAVSDKAENKYDKWLGDELLCADYAARALDVDGAVAVANRLTAG